MFQVAQWSMSFICFELREQIVKLLPIAPPLQLLLGRDSWIGNITGEIVLFS